MPHAQRQAPGWDQVLRDLQMVPALDTKGQRRPKGAARAKAGSKVATPLRWKQHPSCARLHLDTTALSRALKTCTPFPHVASSCCLMARLSGFATPLSDIRFHQVGLFMPSQSCIQSCCLSTYFIRFSTAHLKSSFYNPARSNLNYAGTSLHCCGLFCDSVV